LKLTPIVADDRSNFRERLLEHFGALDPGFSPDEAWDQHYVQACFDDPGICARWIVLGSIRVGFLIYLVELHRFVSKLDGVIREVYVQPEYRRQGLAKQAAGLAIGEMTSAGCGRILVDIIAGDTAASALWRALGFESFTERLVRRVPGR
jgi:ribosomal protein S18 acetylase RimI-like enzyme